MKSNPFPNQFQSSCRNETLDYIPFEIKDSLQTLVKGMKMRGIMIVIGVRYLGSAEIGLKKSVLDYISRGCLSPEDRIRKT